MGEWGQCDTDYPPTAFWKDTQHEHGRIVFSIDYAGREGLFEGLSIWAHEKYRKMQGTYPVISLSFANVKEQDYKRTREKICQLLTNLYVKHLYLRESDVLTDTDKEFLTGYYQWTCGIPMQHLRYISFLISCTASMAKRSLSFWMSMTHRCRRRMSMDSGVNWLLLPGACSTLPSRQADRTIYLTLRIPNEEILSIYENTIREWFNQRVKTADFRLFYEAVLTGKSEQIADFIWHQLL